MLSEQKAFNNILEQFKIRTIVHVDDLFSADNDPTGDLKSWILTFKTNEEATPPQVKEGVRGLLGQHGLQISWWAEDWSDFESLLDSWLNESINTNVDPTALLQQLSHITGEGPPSVLGDDRADIGALGEWVDQNTIRIVQLSWKQWKGGGIETVRESCADGRSVLVFVDLDLSAEGGSSTEGLSLVDSIVEAFPEGAVYTALLTHAVGPENVLQYWRENSENRNPARWCVISKLTLRALGNPNESQGAPGTSPVVTTPPYTARGLDLVLSLRLVLQSKEIELLVKKFSDSILQTTSHTISLLQKAHYVDLCEAIVTRPIDEGIDPLDTMFRLFSAQLRRNSRTTLRGDTGVRKSLARALDVSAQTDELRSALKMKPLARSAWQWEQDEYYEASDLVVGWRLPVANGDLFRIGVVDYVLIAQPCTLMVRSNGRRGRDCNFGSVGTLVPIRENGKCRLKSRAFALKFYVGRESRFACFYESQSAWLAALDLCVFGNNGASELSLADGSIRDNEEGVDGPYLLRNWVVRRKLLVDHFMDRLKAAGLSVSSGGRGMSTSAKPSPAVPVETVPKVLLNGDKKQRLFFTEDTRGPLLFYKDVKRIGRLSEHHATALLTAFSFDAARPAYPHAYQTTEVSGEDQ